MIPGEITDIMDVMVPDWRTLDDEGHDAVLAAARNVYEAGYRKKAD